MLVRGSRATALVSTIALLCTAPASAQPAKDPGQAAYEEGRRLYDLREWDRAIAKFKEAYRLRSDAPSLFNIAQAYRLKGDCVEAVNFYKTFLRNFPKEKGADKAKKFVAELEPCSAQQGAVTPAEPAITTTPPTTTTTTPPSEGPRRDATPPPPAPSATAAAPQPIAPTSPPPRQGGRALKITGMTIAGLGGLALFGGVYFGVKANDAQQELDSSSVWNQDLFDDGQRHSRNAKILFVAGGAAVVTGIALFTFGVRAGREPQLAVVPTAGGGTMVWSCDF